MLLTTLDRISVTTHEFNQGLCFSTQFSELQKDEIYCDPSDRNQGFSELISEAIKQFLSLVTAVDMSFVTRQSPQCRTAYGLCLPVITPKGPYAFCVHLGKSACPGGYIGCIPLDPTSSFHHLSTRPNDNTAQMSTNNPPCINPNSDIAGI